jgi:uncharacterized zinc-type alcohol dehydrogenase-like protein
LFRGTSSTHRNCRQAFAVPGRAVSWSFIGGLAETQEMLDYCAEHNITSDVEVIAIKDINEAYERMERAM